MNIARIHNKVAVRGEAGSVAVEMAAVVVPFLALAFGVLDAGLLMLTDNVVNGAAATAAREIRTGQLRGASDLGAFKTALCAASFGVLDCARLAIDVRTFASWGAVTWPTPVKNANGTITNFGFNPGGASAITTVRVVYPYQVITPGLTFAMDSLDRTATVVMMTEPFP